jgi:hypothetical protein
MCNANGEEYGTVFWDVKPCSLVETYHSLRPPYCLHVQGISVLVYQSHKVIRWLIRILNKSYFTFLLSKRNRLKGTSHLLFKM